MKQVVDIHSHSTPILFLEIWLDRRLQFICSDPLIGESQGVVLTPQLLQLLTDSYPILRFSLRNYSALFLLRFYIPITTTRASPAGRWLKEEGVSYVKKSCVRVVKDTVLGS